MSLQKYTIGKDQVLPIATPYPQEAIREEIEIGINEAARGENEVCRPSCWD